MQSYENIIGNEKVLEFFGYWPSFHDAEVLSMQFNSYHIFEQPGPSLVAKVHAFEMASDVDQNGHYKTIKHCVITFEFDNVEKLEFNGFNHQNAIYGLHFETGKDTNGQPIIYVDFEPSFGVDCKFQCRAALVTAIEEGIPKNSR